MMTKKAKYEDWLSMSDEERNQIIRSWNPYEGEGREIVEKAFERFKESFGKPKGVLDLHCGLYHGGMLIIGVTVSKGSRVRVPKSFEGFPVIKRVK
jgi:hypothetical protein